MGFVVSNYMLVNLSLSSGDSIWDPLLLLVYGFQGLVGTGGLLHL